MATQDPRIIDVVHPTKYNRGGYEWVVKFELPMPAAMDGWIVQEIFKIVAHSQGGNPIPKSFHYWEAWPVKRGSLEITDPYYRLTRVGVSHQYNDVFEDTYGNDSIPRISAGEITIQATARFYEVQLPMGFVKEMPGSLGYRLPGTLSRPYFWVGSGSFRYVFYAWDFFTGFPYQRTSPILRTATKSNAKVFPGSILKPVGTRTWS